MLSLLLHLLILLLFFLALKEVIMPPPPSSEKKITLDLKQFTPPPSAKPTKPSLPPLPKPLPKPVKAVPHHKLPTPQPLAATAPQKIQKKQIDTKKRIVAKKSNRENNATRQSKKRVTKTTQKKKSKKRIAKKKHKPLRVVKKQAKKIYQKRRKALPKRSKLANALLGAGTSVYPTRNRAPSRESRQERMIHKLYGREFDSFTPAQKKFIRDKLGEIHRITQNTLTRNGYPSVAARTRQQGVNVVTFYLHPNGDISGLRLKRRMGYAALDQNTLEVIRTAYMHYPRPKTKTKITFYVNYTLY